MFKTKEEQEERLKYLLENDQDGHEHNCKKCKLYYWCVGINGGLWCKDHFESTCIECSGKHPSAISLWREHEIVGCHECGTEINTDTWNEPPTPQQKLNYFFNPHNWVICLDCENRRLASGKLLKPDDFFDKYGDSLGIEKDGEVEKVEIKQDENSLISNKIN